MFQVFYASSLPDRLLYSVGRISLPI